MKNQWYADPKDIPKWAAIADLIANAAIGFVIYAPMLRASAPIPGLFRCGAPHGSVHDAVKAHFRNVTSLRHLADELAVRWHILDEPFLEANRATYFSRLCRLLEVREADARGVILIDPDNGIAPKNGGDDSEAYVNKADLESVFATMRSGDVLAVYQHIFRAGNHDRLLGHAIERFRTALCLSSNDAIDSYTMPTLTKEAAVIAVAKP